MLNWLIRIEVERLSQCAPGELGISLEASIHQLETGVEVLTQHRLILKVKKKTCPSSRVSDPHFFADPDPGKNFHADPDPGGIRGRGLGVKGKKEFFF